MNLAARHEKRRLQTPAHPCWCEIHRGGNARRREGHFMGPDGIGLWRLVGYPLVSYGPYLTADGLDETVRFEEQPSFYDGRMSGPRKWKGHTASVKRRVRREKKLSKQAQRNPNFPSKEFLWQSAEWIAQGAEVTPSGPVYTARLEESAA